MSSVDELLEAVVEGTLTTKRMVSILLEARSGGDEYFHQTKLVHLDRILKEGLRPATGAGLTHSSLRDMFPSIYGTTPIFVSSDPYRLQSRSDTITLRVDVRGYPLVADIGTLMDYGAHLAEDGIWFEDGEEPTELAPHLDEHGFVSYKALTNPDHPAATAAIDLTKTAAVIEPIPPDRIEVQRKEKR